MSQVERLLVFLASPGDVRTERRYVEEVVSELNHSVPAQNNILLQVISWENNTFPGYGKDAQSIITEQIDEMSKFALFVGIMWNRLGTPTPRAESGTVEEFERAVEAYDKTGKPDIWFYFREPTSNLKAKEQSEQQQKVLAFKQRVESKGLPRTYTGPKDFRDKFRNHLLLWINHRMQDNGSKSEANEVLTAELSIEPPKSSRSDPASPTQPTPSTRRVGLLGLLVVMSLLAVLGVVIIYNGGFGWMFSAPMSNLAGELEVVGDGSSAAPDTPIPLLTPTPCLVFRPAAKSPAAQSAFDTAKGESDPSKRIEAFSEVIKLDNCYLASYINRADAYKARAAAYKNIGDLINAEKDYISAEKDYTEAIERHPEFLNTLSGSEHPHSNEFVESYLRRGQVYSALQDNDSAAEDFSKVIELWPESYQGYFNRALAHKASGKIDEAVGDFCEAQDILDKPENADKDPQIRQDIEKHLSELEKQC